MQSVPIDIHHARIRSLLRCRPIGDRDPLIAPIALAYDLTRMTHNTAIIQMLPALLILAGSPALGVECALPIVVRAAVRDIHESWFNGPVGYGFIEAMGNEKAGMLPITVGREPVRRFDTDVYASNFQGPVAVHHPNLRSQWEWTADGEPQESDRSYPLLAARRCAARAGALPAVIVRIAEHDEWPFANDAVGAFAVDLAACRAVLSATRRSGWSEIQRSDGQAYDQTDSTADVVFVEYVTWCYRCEGPDDCEDAIVWPDGR
jgi:hypothetical protein